MSQFKIIALRSFQFVVVVSFITLLVFLFEGPRPGPSWVRGAEAQLNASAEFKDITRLQCSPDLTTARDNVLHCQTSFENGTANEFSFVANTALNTNVVNFEATRNSKDHMLLYIRPIERSGQKNAEQMRDYVELMKRTALQAKTEKAVAPVSMADYLSEQFAVNAATLNNLTVEPGPEQ